MGAIWRKENQYNFQIALQINLSATETNYGLNSLLFHAVLLWNHLLVNFKCIESEDTEAAIQRCSWEKVFWKSAANLQENTHAEVRF